MKKLFAPLERGLLLMLFAHPVLLLLCELVFPGMPWATLLCELGCLALGLALSMLRVKRRVRLSMLAMLAEAALIAVLPLPWPGRLALLAFLPLTDLLCRNAMADIQDNRCLPFVLVGYALYAICAILARAGFYPAPLRELCFLGALAYLPVSLVLLNESAIREASAARQGVAATKRMKAGNRMLTYGFALLVVAVIYARQLRAALDAIGNALLSAITRVVAFVLRLMTSLMPDATTAGPGGGGEQGFALGEYAEPSAFARFMEKAVAVLAVALMAALVAFVLWTIGRKLLRALRKWMAALRKSWMSSDVGYEDEMVTTLHFGDSGERARTRARRRRRPDWNALSREERVRYVAGRIMERMEHAPSDTPRALLQRAEPELIEGYEIARYSSQPVSDEQLALAEALYHKR